MKIECTPNELKQLIYPSDEPHLILTTNFKEARGLSNERISEELSKHVADSIRKNLEKYLKE